MVGVFVGETYDYRLSDADYSYNIDQHDVISITEGSEYATTQRIPQSVQPRDNHMFFSTKRK